MNQTGVASTGSRRHARRKRSFTGRVWHGARRLRAGTVAGHRQAQGYPAGSYRVTPRWMAPLFASGGCHSTRARTSCVPKSIVVVENIGYIAGSFRIATAHVVIAEVTSACCISTYPAGVGGLFAVLGVT